jgi:glycosyltransferase involved in cell wall biosynthesis
MRIVQVPRRFVKSEWGGTETVVLETCKRLQSLGHAIEIICPKMLSRISRETIEEVSVERVPYFYPYFGLDQKSKEQMDKKGGNAFSFALLRELSRRPHIDLIHLHTGKRIGAIGRYAARKRKIPYVISLHGGVLDVPAREAQTWTEPTRHAFEWGKILGWWTGSRRVLQDASAIICVGKHEAEMMKQKHPGNRIDYLPNGVAVEKFETGDGLAFREKYEIPKDKRIILIVGRIDVQKNQLMAVQILPELLRSNSHFHLLIIGFITNQQYYSQLVQEISRLNLSNQVTIIPGLSVDTNDLADAYHAADLFLLPSQHEPFGIVILEAWASKLPVIASRVGGIPYFVEHERNGILCNPTSSAEFIEAIIKLDRDPDCSKKIEVEGFLNVRQNYSWEQITKQLEQIYVEVVRDYSRNAEKEVSA